MTTKTQDAPAIKGPVTQEWTHRLTFMQQTVLLTAIRGPDGTPKYGPTKMLLRWYRRCLLVSSLDGCVLDNPYDLRGGSFMGPSLLGPAQTAWFAGMDQVVSDYLRELDGLPHHFQMHFMHAAQIMGYKHTSAHHAIWWLAVYNRLVKDFHLLPESEEALDFRLGDSRDQWLSTADPATSA